jgi:DNA polymerase III sliding clamp (beta) subunit (PCNA family)
MAWFKVGSEYRYAPLKLDGSFPDCRKLIPEDHDGPHLTVDTDKLVGAVKRATIVSPLKTVALDFNGGEVVIKSWSAEEGGKAFRAALGGYPGSISGKALKVISGKLLSEALKQVETPNVRLCYRDLPNDPLRVESGAFVECLWPWKVGEAS